MLDKLLGSLGLDGITINIMIGNVIGMRIVFGNIYLDILDSGEHTGFLEIVKITLVDKTDGQILIKKKTAGGHNFSTLFISVASAIAPTP